MIRTIRRLTSRAGTVSLGDAERLPAIHEIAHLG